MRRSFSRRYAATSRVSIIARGRRRMRVARRLRSLGSRHARRFSHADRRCALLAGEDRFARQQARDQQRARRRSARRARQTNARAAPAECASPRSACFSSEYWPETGTSTIQSGSFRCRNSWTTGMIDTTKISTDTLACASLNVRPRLPTNSSTAGQQQRSAAAARPGTAPNSRAPNRNGTPTAGSGANDSVR